MINRRFFFKLGISSLGSLWLMGAGLKNHLIRPQKEEKMKRLGMIGGTSWHSTIDYYRYINQMVNDELGNRVNPPLLLFNLSQKQIHDLQQQDDWDSIAEIYYAAGTDLQKAGAEGLIFCANTAYAVYGPVSSRLDIPILHIADATAREAKKQNISELGLLGTRFTMEKDYIKGRLITQNNFNVMVPEEKARVELQRIIREELSAGQIIESSKSYLIGEMDKLKSRGAKGMVLGCTEFPILVKQKDYPIPIFDTTHLHSKMAVDFILGRI